MPAESDDVVICGAARTPIGAFRGALSSFSATSLGGHAVAGAIARAKVDPGAVEHVFMGCVLAAGLGQSPARQAALAGGLRESVAATTINKMCGSGLQATIFAYDSIRAGSASVAVAGGMESMSNAPYLLARGAGRSLGNRELVDSLRHDGLEDAQEVGVLMGEFAERDARARGVSRDAMDAYAAATLARARSAYDRGVVADEIVGIPTPNGNFLIDEAPRRADPHRIPTLEPAFAPNGLITAASSSSIADGAAALLLSTRSRADTLHLPALARIAGHAVFAGRAPQFPVAPVHAIRALLARLDWPSASVDVYEVNEAFALVPMIAMRELSIPASRMNVRGGACALGHPLGATGARILVTLLHALAEADGRRGIASACLAGGEAVVVAIERSQATAPV